MKDIKECANLYKQLLNKSYTFKLENDIEFTIHFNSSNFFHLIGLHKLTDLERITNNSKSVIFKKILKGDISQKYIEKSDYYKKIVNRIKYFENILDMFDINKTKIIVDFDPLLLDFDSELQYTKYILYKKLDNGCTHTTIGQENEKLYAETFFYDPTYHYLSEQDLLNIESITVIDRKKYNNVNLNNNNKSLNDAAVG